MQRFPTLRLNGGVGFESGSLRPMIDNGDF